MNAPTDDQPEPLIDERYRRASAEDAGKPSQATRAAILREARLEAMRRAPAANDSSWKIRAVAGIAVVGLASLILFEANRQGHLPVQAPAPAAAPVVADTGTAMSEREERAAPPESRRDADSKPRARANSSSAVARAPVPASPTVPEMKEKQSIEPARDAAAASPPPRPLEETDIAQKQAAEPAVEAATAGQVTGGLAKSGREAPQARAALSEPQSAGDDQALFARSFPAVFASQSTARSVWLVQDAAGHVLRRGELPGDQTSLEMDEVGRHVSKGLQVERHRVVTVATEQGVPVQMLIIVASP